MSFDPEKLSRIVEGAIIAAGKPLTIDKILSLFEDENPVPDKDAIKVALDDIAEACHGRGYELIKVASGYRFQVVEEYAPWVSKLWDEKPPKYSRALLETLALIAYRQPITRGEIEDIRGVAVSSHIIKTLTERQWIKTVGHKEVPGRPVLYASTQEFLDYFSLTSLAQLPELMPMAEISG